MNCVRPRNVTRALPGFRALTSILLRCLPTATTRGQSLLSNQHRLLSEDARHRTLPGSRGDRGNEGVGEVAGGVDAGHAGFAALVDPEGDAEGRIDRGETQ